MEFRTKVNTGESNLKITFSDPVMFIGSCFASEMGAKLEEGKLPVMINPAGTVYNPVSVAATLRAIMDRKIYTTADLYLYNDTWLSFSHYTDFSSNDPDKVLHKINSRIKESSEFLKSAKFLFITFGTSRIFSFKETGIPVSNCHKLPSSFFTRELLTVDQVVILWNKLLHDLKSEYPEINVIFTVSPVRHWKDGAHGNQVSKAVLFLAIESLLAHPSSPGYFPAYEIMMDELRDYRFYDKDMLHPSEIAVDYIWEAFSGTYLDSETLSTWKEAASVSTALKHRITSDSPAAIARFASVMLERISRIQSRHPEIDFTDELTYFRQLK